ncbi:hypothetical protein GCM10023221_14350 [Luteimicrobium xylanilyticum]
MLIPVTGVVGDGSSCALRAAGELARAGHRVEIFVAGFDPAITDAVRDQRNRGEITPAVRVVNPYHERSAAGAQRTERAPSRLATLLRWRHSARATEDVDEAGVAWMSSTAVSPRPLVPLSPVLSSRVVEERRRPASEQVVHWSDGAIARRTRIDGDGWAYQHDYLQRDGRAYLVEWAGRAGSEHGTVRVFDHESATVRRLRNLQEWEMRCLSERARGVGGVILTTSDWAAELVRGVAFRGALRTSLLDGSSATEAVTAVSRGEEGSAS